MRRVSPVARILVGAGGLALAACSGGAASTEPPDSTSTSTSTTSVPTSTAPPGSTTTAPPATIEPQIPPEASVPDVPTDPAQLAAALVAAEQTARDESQPAPQRTAAARAAQAIYRIVGDHPDLDGAVLAAIPPELQKAVTLNLDTRRQLASIPGVKIQDTLPAWRIIEPAPEADLRSHYDNAEAEFGVAWQYLAAINLVETGMGRIQGLSTAGAQGPMQFMPATWEAYGAGGDVNSPHDAILGAARYLAANGFADGNVDGALWNYNHSDHYVAAIKNIAMVLIDDPRAFGVYYRWDVYYRTTAGTVLLPVGYEAAERFPVADYLAEHPARLLGP